MSDFVEQNGGFRVVMEELLGFVEKTAGEKTTMGQQLDQAKQDKGTMAGDLEKAKAVNASVTTRLTKAEMRMEGDSRSITRLQDEAREDKKRRREEKQQEKVAHRKLSKLKSHYHVGWKKMKAIVSDRDDKIVKAFNKHQAELVRIRKALLQDVASTTAALKKQVQEITAPITEPECNSAPEDSDAESEDERSVE